MTFSMGSPRQLGYRLITFLLGMVLLAAGMLKGIDLDQFALQIRQYHLLPAHDALIAGAAWIMVVVEAALGAALVLAWRPRAALAGATVLLLAFLAMLVWAVAHGDVADCGCFGPAVRRTPMEALVEDTVLLLLAAAAWRLRAPAVTVGSRVKGWIVASVCLLAAALPMVLGPLTATRSVAGTGSPHASVGPVLESISGEIVDLSQGTVLLILMSTECSHCRESVPALNELVAATERAIRAHAVAADDPAEIDRFVDDHFPFFPVQPIDADRLASLMDEAPLPQYLLIREGQILARWQGEVPDYHAVMELVAEGKDE